MNTQRKYQFSWDLLGDIQLGRPNLGNSVRLEVYRLMQFCFRDVLESNFGTEKTDELFYNAGKLAGQNVYQELLADASDFNEFVKRLQEVLKDLNIGVLRVEEAHPEQGRFVLTVSEDVDCSGLPELDFEICTYDEGFISALMEGFTGKRFAVKEVDCWCTGDRTCRFTANVVE